MCRNQWQVHLRLATKGDQAHLDLGAQTTFLGESRHHVLHRSVERFDLAVLPHAATCVSQDDHGERPGRGDSEFFETAHLLCPLIRLIFGIRA